MHAHMSRMRTYINLCIQAHARSYQRTRTRTHIEGHRHTGAQAHRCTGAQAHRRTGAQAPRQAHTHTHTHTHAHADACTHAERMDVGLAAWLRGCAAVRLHGCMAARLCSRSRARACGDGCRQRIVPLAGAPSGRRNSARVGNRSTSSSSGLTDRRWLTISLALSSFGVRVKIRKTFCKRPRLDAPFGLRGRLSLT